MMPHIQAAGGAMRPMFGIWVDHAQGMFDGGLIDVARTGTLVQAGRYAEVLASIDRASNIFQRVGEESSFGPSERRMIARAHTMKAAVLLKLNRVREGLAEARAGLSAAETN